MPIPKNVTILVSSIGPFLADYVDGSKSVGCGDTLSLALLTLSLSPFDQRNKEFFH